MARFRLDSIGTLARQLGFTPAETRAAQLTAAEQLLHELDGNRAYPLDFVVYRITGYQPKLKAESDLLTGLALQHDLGMLIEQVSLTLKLVAHELAEPVLSIADVTEKFNVTSKTIQRWRRKGLPARRFIFPDGKCRVGFLLSSVERFISSHREQIVGVANSSEMGDAERVEIIRRANRLATECGCSSTEIARRLGRRLHRSPLAILHTIRKHDAEHPKAAVFAGAAAAVTEEKRCRIVRQFKRGISLKRLSTRFKRRRAVIYRVILEDRIDRLTRRKVKFIDDVLYHDADAEILLKEMVSQEELAEQTGIEDGRVPRDLPPFLKDLYRFPLLTPARERAMFLKFNFHKWQFVSARRRLEPQFAKSKDLEVLEGYLRQAIAAKNEIVQANLRLVVSVARRHVRGGASLVELFSEGNIALMRAVESFDVHKGNRFSTYATLALLKGFARSVPMMVVRRGDVVSGAALNDVADRRPEQLARQRIDRDEVEQLLKHLSDRERRVLLAHYGLENERSVPASFAQLSDRLGMPRQILREIERSAMEKLRAAALEHQ